MAVNTKLLLKDIKRPKSITFSREDNEEFYGRFTAAPLVPGFGHTLGNAIRRTLLSALPGSAISAVKIDYVSKEGRQVTLSSEFENIDGMVEDTIDLVQHLKKVRVRLDDSVDSLVLRKDIKLTQGENELVLRAGDLQVDPRVKILNPDHVLATFNEDAEIYMELQVDRGRGWMPAERNTEFVEQIGTIAIDATFSPVQKVAFNVEKFRVGQRTDYDKLVLEVWSDGTTSPDDAVASAAKILKEYLLHFMNFEDTDELPDAEEDEETSPRREIFDRSIEDLELSVRSTNCLKVANIRTVGDLVSKSSEELEKIKNLGKKSIEEIEAKLVEFELQLGMKDAVSKTKKSGLLA